MPVIISSGVIVYVMAGSPIAGQIMSNDKGTLLFKGIEFSKMLLGFGLPLQVINVIMGVVNSVFVYYMEIRRSDHPVFIGPPVDPAVCA